jgi:gliding motility-associated-like protein
VFVPVLCQRRILPLKFIFFFLSFFVICRASSQYISTFAGSGQNGCTGEGVPAISAGLPFPESICFDLAGNFYVNCSISIRKVDAQTGLISRFAGNGQHTYSGDGGPATDAALYDLLRVCSDKSGNIYISDATANRIRKVSPSGVITTIAGTGTPGFSGDGGPAISATLNAPWGLATDGAGNLYFFDDKNFRIRKVDASTGIITTIAGTGVSAYSADGSRAAGASIGVVVSMFVHKNGDIYFSEAHQLFSSYVRKITASTGIITTIAGNGSYAYSGDDGPALDAGLLGITGIALDAADNIYISEYEDGRIRRIDAATGIITTFAGTGRNGFNGESGPATTTRLNYPRGLAFDAEGNLYVADGNNLRVRKISNTPLCTTPTISITTPSALYCFNTANYFTATVTEAGPTVAYQWKRNGSPVASNDPIAFITDTVGDVITCELTTTNSCGNQVTVVSNSITVQSNPGYNRPPEVTITATQDTLCAGTQVSFTATNVSQSTVISYQWLVNGLPAGTNSPTFSTKTLTDGAKVECIMTVPQCSNTGTASTKDYSNPIVVKVYPLLNPGISITTPLAGICKGDAATFSATASQAGANPVYQWKVNGVNVGNNSAIFTSTTLNDGDAISCELSVDPSAHCASKATIVSNIIVLQVQAVLTPSVQITASKAEICEGTPVHFSATIKDAGERPSYQWLLNGNNTGTNSAQLRLVNLKDGDKINCVLTPATTTCTKPAASNTLSIRVYPVPDIQFNPPAIVIEPGKTVQLKPVVQGTIARHVWTPQNLLTDASSLTPYTLPLTTTANFQLWVQSPEGCEDTASLLVTVYTRLFVPNSFTPNGDGKNDVFRIPPAAAFTLKEFTVFDRWGNKIFSTTNISKGWDGKKNGGFLAADTYVYLISGKDSNGDVLLKGTVQLIR